MNHQIKRLFPLQLRLVLAIALVNLVLIFISEGICDAPDTISYIESVDLYLTQHYDTFRTVGYPLVIYLCQVIFGSSAWPFGLVAVQALMFLLSVCVMWHLLYSVSRRKMVATIISIYYAVAPGISTYVTNILTESLTISLSVLMIACVYLILFREKVSKWVLGVFFISLSELLMLRPGSIALLASVGVAVMGAFVFKKKCRYALVVLTVVSLLPVAVQYYRTWRTLGVFTSTQVTLMNRYSVVFFSGGSFSPDSTDHPLLKEYLGRFEKKDSADRNPYYEIKVNLLHCGAPAVDSLLNRYHSPYFAVGKRLKTAICDYPLLYGHIEEESLWSNRGQYTVFLTHFPIFSIFRYWLVPVTLLLGCVIFFIYWRKDRRMAVFVLFLLAILSAISYTAVIYAPDSFSRLTLTASPAMLLLWGLMFGKATFRKITKQ